MPVKSIFRLPKSDHQSSLRTYFGKRFTSIIQFPRAFVLIEPRSVSYHYFHWHFIGAGAKANAKTIQSSLWLRVCFIFVVANFSWSLHNFIVIGNQPACLRAAAANRPTNQPTRLAEWMHTTLSSLLPAADIRSAPTLPAHSTALIIYEIFCGRPGVDACTGCSDRRTRAADQWWPRHRLLRHSARSPSDAPTCFNFKHKCASLQ